MSETKHTPGPWAVAATMPKQNTGGHKVCLVSRLSSLDPKAGFDRFYDQAIIAMVIGETVRTKEDARLIAAAPDLLAELVKMRGRFYAALVSTGTDAEFASAAVADADLAIKRATRA